MRRFRYFGEVIVFLGVVLWSLNAPLVKFIQVDSVLVCGMRSAIAGAVLLPFLRVKKLNWNRWMALYLLSFAGLSITIIFSLRMTDSAIAVGMQYTALVWLLLIDVVRGVRMTHRQLVPLGLILAGIVIFMASGILSGSYVGNLVALSEGVFFAGMTLSSRKAAGANPLGLTALANAVTGLIVFVFLSPPVGSLAALSAQDWLILVVLGVFQIGGGHALYNLGLQYVAPKRASIIALGEMILGPLWVALFLSQYPSPVVAAGLAVILIGMLLDICWNDG